MLLYRLIIPRDLISVNTMQSKKLFKGLKFYFIGDFLVGYKNDLINLVTTAGGTVIKTENGLGRYPDILNDYPTKNPLVIYNDDPTHESNYGDENYILSKRLRKAQKLADMIDSRALPPSWILDSIAACNLKPLDRESVLLYGLRAYLC
ncbi:hypothetical protein LguiA_020549 [Lonicera macranthoides]